MIHDLCTGPHMHCSASTDHNTANDSATESEALLRRAVTLLETVESKLSNHAGATASAISAEATTIMEVKNLVLHTIGLIENSAINLTHFIGERSQEALAETICRTLAIEARLARQSQSKARQLQAKKAPSPTVKQSFAATLQMAREYFPRQFADWHDRLLASGAAINQTAVGNLAHGADPYSRAFRSFVEIHARGTILDVGCGNVKRPYYLSSFSAEQLSGLDPLQAKETPDFAVEQGIGEFLPWADNSFDTVISATAIDHALSLERTLSEVRRVLVPTGAFLMWVGSVPGARQFDPSAPDYTPADAYHLFHVDRAWFEPLLEQSFVIEDRVLLWRQSHEHVFYRLTVR